MLTPGVFERWKQGQGIEKDWIGQEIDQAVKLNKTVLPVMIDEVGTFIEKYSQERPLPAEIQHILATYKRTSYFSDQPDASIESIAKNLKPSSRKG